jgi:hypothetical protein
MVGVAKTESEATCRGLAAMTPGLVYRHALAPRSAGYTALLPGMDSALKNYRMHWPQGS